MVDNILEARDVNYTYADGTHALKGINLQIKRGQTTAILGGNGAGKSTLFMSFNGIIKPSSGKILFNNSPVYYSGKGLKELRQKVGLVFQDPDNQLFSASVYGDISFGALNMKLPEEEVRRRVEASLEKAGIRNLKDKPTHCLSFGQKKRAAVAGVLAMEPEVIILDEPTAGLDSIAASSLMRLFKKMQKEQNITFVISTHDVDLISVYCDYVYVMNDGKIVLEGRPDEVFKNRKALRENNLRLPRIGHLMEILHEKDGINIDTSAMSISEARKAIKKLASKMEGEGTCLKELKQ